ncbi:MAG TPA: hypothetical protein VFK06_16775 [Candidatus Angelobacter sp.]|nr:hypothetical protein [Candidatus Angelobacter sp.]
MVLPRAAACGPGGAREIIFAGRTEPPLGELILLTLTGAVTYLGALFVLGRTVIGEGAEVAGWIFRRHGLDRTLRRS